MKKARLTIYLSGHTYQSSELRHCIWVKEGDWQSFGGDVYTAADARRARAITFCPFMFTAYATVNST